MNAPAFIFFTIGITTASAFAAYVDRNLLFGREQLRLEIMNMVRDKAATCSYSLREKKEFSSLLAKATEVLNDNGRASEAIWNTFAELLQNVIGFVIYFALLKNVNAVVLGVTVLTAILGYLMNYRINRWDYWHRREVEEPASKILYIQNRALDRYLAKDIRIFRMQEWLRALYGKYMRLYRAFYGKREMRYFAADLTDLALTVLCNAVAYGYLLYMALGGRIGAAEFLLYFTAVGGFSKWLTGIMENITMIYRQGVELDSVREVLNYKELFLMEGGESVEADENGGYTIALRNVSFRYAEDYDMDKVSACIDKAGVKKKIETLPQKYEYGQGCAEKYFP